jgi:hypothetical protein
LVRFFMHVWSEADSSVRISTSTPTETNRTTFGGWKTLSAVTVGTSAVALASSQTAKAGFLVQANAANLNEAYLGDSSVTTSNGLRLDPGDSMFLALRDPSQVFAISPEAEIVLRVVLLDPPALVES